MEEQVQETKKRTGKKKVVASTSAPQCPSMLLCRGGLIVFCTKRRGHDGDHRGTRAQWRDGQKRVPITEPLVT